MGERMLQLVRQVFCCLEHFFGVGWFERLADRARFEAKSSTLFG